MELQLDAAVRERALAHLVAGSLIQAVSALHAAGLGIAEAKAWAESRSGSSDPLEAAVGQAWEAASQDYREQRNAAADEAARLADERLAAGLKHAFPAGLLDRALDVLFTGSGEEQAMARERAAHLCRLANSLCLAWREGQCSQAEAEAILHSGAPGFSPASYARVWQNALGVTGPPA
jgi:hypothetical protein